MRTPGQQSRAVRWEVAAVSRHHPRNVLRDRGPKKQKGLAWMATLGLLALPAGCGSGEEPARLNVASSVTAATLQKVTQVITTLDIGLFDNASGSSFQRPALEVVGTLAAGGTVRSATSPEGYFVFGAGAALSTITLPGSFTGLRRLEVKLKLNPNACSSCRVALTVDNIAVR